MSGREVGRPLVAVVGVTGGLLSGLLGIGGGIVMVPLLVLAAGLPQRDAHAVSLAAIVPISLAGVLVYAGAGRVRVAEALALTVGSVVGARLGAALLARFPEPALKAVFGTFLLLAAASIAVRG